MDIAGKTFNLVAVLTAIVVLGYVAVSGIAFAMSATTWTEFSGAVGPIAGMLLGYFIRGDKSA